MAPGPSPAGGSRPGDGGGSLRRFLTLADVAEVLNTSPAQVYVLVRSGELPAIKLGGRGQWRVEIAVLDAYIEGLYDATKRTLDENRRGSRPDDASASDEAADGGAADVPGSDLEPEDDIPTR